MKCLHVITGLFTGGAEMMLYKLLSALSGRGDHAVVSLVSGGPLHDRIAALGIDVTTLGASRGQLPTPAMFWRLRALTRRFGPHVVQGWMYHGNLAAQAGAAGRGRASAVLWNVRSTLATGDEERPTTSGVIRLGARMSGLPDRIVYPSETAAREHEAIGYARDARVVIGNGFDTERLSPDPVERAAVRGELGVPAGMLLLGHVARYHRMKDHATLLRAFATLVASGLPLRLAMIGRDVDERNRTLTELRDELRLGPYLHLLGERHDVPRLTRAFDLAVSSSAWGEAFPNVLGEAMACAVPCVATDVGDSAHIVADTGRIVPPRAPAELAAAIDELTRLPHDARAALGAAARRRIVEHYALPVIVSRYEALYAEVAALRRSAA